jgi:uncharacterized membrane protein YphA (DoxX/SURF4 family)
MSQYAQDKRVPLPPVAVLSTGALLNAGGASLLLGLSPKWGAAAIIAFLIGACALHRENSECGSRPLPLSLKLCSL